MSHRNSTSMQHTVELGPRTKRALLLAAPVLLIVLGVLVYWIRDFIREHVLIPLIHTGWFIRGFVDAVPQAAWWVVIVVLVAYASFRALMRGAPSQDTRYRSLDRELRGRIATLSEWLHGAAARRYPAAHIVRHLGELIRQASGMPDATNQQLIDMFADTDTGLPPEVREYCRGLLAPEQKTVKGRFIGTIGGLLSKRVDDGGDNIAHIETLVRYLEDQLEVDSESRHRNGPATE